MRRQDKFARVDDIRVIQAEDQLIHFLLVELASSLFLVLVEELTYPPASVVTQWPLPATFIIYKSSPDRLHHGTVCSSNLVPHHPSPTFRKLLLQGYL